MDAGIIPGMAPDTPEQAAHRRQLRDRARLRAAQSSIEEGMIRAAVAAGVPQTVVARELGRSREYVRLVLRRGDQTPHEPASV